MMTVSSSLGPVTMMLGLVQLSTQPPFVGHQMAGVAQSASAPGVRERAPSRADAGKAWSLVIVCSQVSGRGPPASNADEGGREKHGERRRRGDRGGKPEDAEAENRR